MSLAKFFERFGRVTTPPVVRLEDLLFSIAPITPGMRVRLGDDVGVVEWIDTDRIVWRDAKGAVHFSLSHHLERADGK